MDEVRSVFVIGAGTAGTKAARELAAAGVKVTVAESREPGGTCVWRGCVPKKALAEAAATLRGLAAADRFGLSFSQPLVLDWDELMAWKGRVQETYNGDQRAGFAQRDIELIEEQARFVSPEEIAVAGRTYRPDAVIVATGSESVRPSIPGIELADTSAAALGYAERPASLVILGGGYIAMEFAAIYASFGTQVTVVVRGGRLLPRFDREAAELVWQGLEGLGVTFLMHTAVAGLTGSPGDLRLELTDAAGRTSELSAARVLAATGRRPALRGLDLEKAGVRLDEHGAPVVDAALRTTNPRVWMAGDASGGIELTPVANLEGERVAGSILSGAGQPVDLSVMPTACFSLPQVAQVGLTEDRAIATGAPYAVVRGDFQYNAQAIIAEQTGGLVKAIVSPGERVLGAVVAGPHAAELIYAFTLAVRSGMTLGQIRSARAVHPSLGEALNGAAYAEVLVSRMAA